MAGDVRRSFDEKLVSTFSPITSKGKECMAKITKDGEEVVIEDAEAAARFHGKLNEMGCTVRT